MKTIPQHSEQHFMASDTVRDIVIEMSDRLTVPFAIAAGMSGAAVAAKIVIAAGSISMGLGGYLAGKTDVEHYEAEQQREIMETEDVPEQEADEVVALFLPGVWNPASPDRYDSAKTDEMRNIGKRSGSL